MFTAGYTGLCDTSLIVPDVVHRFKYASFLHGARSYDKYESASPYTFYVLPPVSNTCLTPRVNQSFLLVMKQPFYIEQSRKPFYVFEDQIE